MRHLAARALIPLLLAACSHRPEQAVLAGKEPIYLIMEGYCPDATRLETAGRRGPAAGGAMRGNVTLEIKSERESRLEPVGTATVTLKKDSTDAEPVATGQVSYLGIVTWRDLPARSYWASVVPLGYSDARGRITVRPGGNDTIEVIVRMGAVGCLKR